MLQISCTVPKPFDNKPSHSMCCHLAIVAGTNIIYLCPITCACLRLLKCALRDRNCDVLVFCIELLMTHSIIKRILRNKHDVYLFCHAVCSRLLSVIRVNRDYNPKIVTSFLFKNNKAYYSKLELQMLQITI